MRVIRGMRICCTRWMLIPKTAMWASEIRTRDPWTARYVPTSNGEAEPPHPLPYGTTPRWIGTAEVVPIDPPRIDLLDFRTDGDVIEVRVRVASSRRANVITLHADRPVETATITVDGQPPRPASPSYPQAAGARAGPTSSASMTLRRTDSLWRCNCMAAAPRSYMSATTPVGLEQLPGLLRDRPRWIGRPTTAQASLSLAVPSAPDRPCSA